MSAYLQKHFRLANLCLVALFMSAPVRSQEPLDCSRPIGSSNPPSSQAARLQLFRIPTGFLSTPIGMEDDDGPPINCDEKKTDDIPIQAALGLYNPYYDFRRPGDPGDVGYYKLYTQYQFLDTGSTGLSMIVQGYTPAGPEVDGLATGPTVICPQLAWFQDLGSGTAIQGFVGKNVRANPNWVGGMGSKFQYGVGIHTPCPGLCDDSYQPVHLFVEALGRYRYDIGPSRPAIWEVLPGIQWRLSETWWLSSGLLVPVGATRPSPDRWQITCRWQF